MTDFTVLSDVQHAILRDQIQTLTDQLEARALNTADFGWLKHKVESWAFQRGIYDVGSNSTAQLLKAVSEMGELADAESKNNIEECSDAVGDVLVCLINYCKLKKLDIMECLYGSYLTISQRSGKMVNGVFVKD